MAATIKTAWCWLEEDQRMGKMHKQNMPSELLAKSKLVKEREDTLLLEKVLRSWASVKEQNKPSSKHYPLLKTIAPPKPQNASRI